MKIIDAQVHIWGADTRDRPWIESGKEFAQRAEPFGKDELLREMDGAAVDRVVIVPPFWEGDRNDLALEAARLHSDRFAVMGRFPIERPESRKWLSTWKEQPGMLGVRLTFSRGPQRFWLSDGTADWFWEAAEQYAIPVMVFAPGSALKIGEVAARHPALRLVIDHLALPLGVHDEAIGPALSPLLELARYANVAVKASGLPGYVTEEYPFPSLYPHIRRVVEAFGPQRVFWGSDLTNLRCTYLQVVSLFTEKLDFLSHVDKEWIMGRGIAAWLDWNIASR